MVVISWWQCSVDSKTIYSLCSCVFKRKMHQNSFSAGLYPEPRRGSSRLPHRPCSRLGRWILLPLSSLSFPFPLASLYRRLDLQYHHFFFYGLEPATLPRASSQHSPQRFPRLDFRHNNWHYRHFCLLMVRQTREWTWMNEF